MAIANYFYEAMPENTVLSRIERWESKRLFMQYAAYKESVRTELVDWKLEEFRHCFTHCCKVYMYLILLQDLSQSAQ